MDKPRRDNLRSVVGEARRAIESSLRKDLVGYGLLVDGEPLGREHLALLPEQEAHYARVLDAVRREGRATGSAVDIQPEAVARYVREAGGTWINRLAALRALEARGLLTPACALVSEDYGGISPRAMEIREKAAAEGRRTSPDEALREAIREGCKELSESVRVLFDLTDEQSLFWPDVPTLRTVLRLFTERVTESDWREPDILGWVYQYYNTEANAELKKRKNKTTNFKYKPDDIPIANQFYTPHWVVRVLTDNTLGRLWLEANDRIPRLLTHETEEGGEKKSTYQLDERRSGVPHAAREGEAFRAWIAEEPDPLVDRTLDRLCRFLVPLPSDVPPREKKRVRDLRVLDPACGSGHFLLYAFDLLFTMYREAEPDIDPRLIPSLILEHNLFGIDIDLRAAQLAAFGLYLKARTVLHAIDPQAEIRLRRLNIVVADAHIGDDPRKAELLDRYKDAPEIQELYRKILADLDHTNVLGSLLKVRTEFEALFGRVTAASQERLRKKASAWVPAGQQTLPGLSTAPQMELRDVVRTATGRTFTLDQLLEELRGFEQEVLPKQDIGARLFYTDVGRTVGLVGLLSRQYDVVLMNPPYGDMPLHARLYLNGNKKEKASPRYPTSGDDLYTSFMEQGVDLLVPCGLLGALVPWGYTFATTLQSFRSQIVMGRCQPLLLQEYGYGILDGATVGTVGTILSKTEPKIGDEVDKRVTFNRLSHAITPTEKLAQYSSSIVEFLTSGPSPTINWFIRSISSIRRLPFFSFGYTIPESIIGVFERCPPLDIDSAKPTHVVPRRKLANVKQGMSTGDDARFLRFWWEVRRERIGRDRDWVLLAKGGTENHFFCRLDNVVYWKDDGALLKKWASSAYGDSHWSRLIQGHQYYFMPGITFSRRARRARPFALLPKGNIFSDSGQTIILENPDSTVAVLGILCSSFLSAIKFALSPDRKWEVRVVASFPIPQGDYTKLSEVTRELVQNRSLAAVEDEASIDFASPLLRIPPDSRSSIDGVMDLRGVVGCSRALLTDRVQHESDLLARLDDEVYRLYGLIDKDQDFVIREMSQRHGAKIGVENSSEDTIKDNEESLSGEKEATDLEESEGDEEDSLSDRDLVARWLSFYLKQTIESDDDGIVPVIATHNEPALIVRLRETMTKDLGPVNSQALENQAPAYLGTETLAEWLETSGEETIDNNGKKTKVPWGFFPWHVQLYRNRPIFWLVSSENFEKGKTRITFRAYLHYLKLTPTTLHRLLEYYVIPVVDQAQREADMRRDSAARLDGKERKIALSEAQEWINTVAALKLFREALEKVISGPPKAEAVPEKAKWLQRTIAEVRGGRDVGHGYQPDVDHGVRVNIKPLAEAKLLPRVVLKKLGG